MNVEDLVFSRLFIQIIKDALCFGMTSLAHADVQFVPDQPHKQVF